MRQCWLAGLVLLGATLPAAADMNGYGYGYAAAPPPSSWNGFYIGANAGYGWGSAGITSPDGFLGGVQAGYNVQMGGGLVAGLEADIDTVGISDGPYSLNYLGTVRARLGFALDRFLAYGTLGFAYGGGSYEVAGLSNDQTHAGWTIGFGGEVALDRNWSAKAEYLYVDLGASTYSSLAGPASVGLDTSVIRGGVNYRF